ncbi:MAG: pyridoxal phosphate-dependent aminotransferase family protein [Cytophagales bacterium]|nr:MAG: pyridoxal phosphate-dependent aminotransferase family protein [Cytophagales bacterium]
MFFSSKHPDRTVSTEKGELLFFSGTSYLGMAVNTDFQELIKEGIGIYGTNYGSSRTSNLRLNVFEQAEEYLCEWTGAAASLTMSSGFLAGQLIAQWIRELASNGYTIIYAPHTHPAVFSGLEQEKKQTFEQWTADARAIATSVQKLVLVCNSVDVLNAQVHDFQWLKEIISDNNREIILIADDSHGIGVIGKNGNGIFSQIPDLQNIKKVVVASLGKALGMSAGIVLANADVIDKLRKSTFYSGASPALPAYLYAFLRAKHIHQTQLEKLKENISLFSSQLSDFQLFDYTLTHPVFRTYQNDLYAYLLENKVLISSFPYPTPDSELITRVVLSSLHTKEDIEKLLMLLRQKIS